MARAAIVAARGSGSTDRIVKRCHSATPLNIRGIARYCEINQCFPASLTNQNQRLRSEIATIRQVEHAETRLILIRHGESNATVERFLGGPASCTGLSELGVAQAERLHDRIAATGEPQVDVVLASPLPRARQTADIIAPAWNREVVEDRELIEHDPGPICDGMAIDEFIDTYGMPDWNDDPFVRFFPDGETIGDLHTRIGKAITRIVDTYQGHTVSLVCHGGVVSAALRIALTAPIIGRFELPTVNTSLTELIHLRPGRWRIGRYNDAAHLVGLPTYTPPETAAPGRQRSPIDPHPE